MELEPLTMEELKEMLGDKDILIAQLQKTLVKAARPNATEVADLDINRTNGAADTTEIPLGAN